MKPASLKSLAITAGVMALVGLAAACTPASDETAAETKGADAATDAANTQAAGADAAGAETTETETTETAAAPSACADDGPTFPGTGLCVGRSVNYLDPSSVASDEGLPEGCVWEMNETMMIGDEALLYQALQCGDNKKTELEFAGGAKTASLSVTHSGFFGAHGEPLEVAKIVSLFEVTDPKARILDFAREAIEDAEESAACDVVELGKGEPGGLLTVDANEAYKKQHGLFEGDAVDEGYSACGPYGYTSDSNRFWRVTGGYAFFFDFGQDMPDFNASSLTVIQKNSDGDWLTVE